MYIYNYIQMDLILTGNSNTELMNSKYQTIKMCIIKIRNKISQILPKNLLNYQYFKSDPFIPSETYSSFYFHFQ
jgi:hypothetical protein